ncbi:glycosyltransferase family 2 protein [Candidatus Dojkabacteria bacterium]|jgi:hypothetical protein|nr:glycosyltransferase family 2 protein [Candidatus Dojkabacteria bacterium]
MISVILNVYKRPHILEKQIEVIKNQSINIDSKNIHVWYNKSDVPQTLPKDSNINTYNCNWNTKFFGRFTIPLMIKTPYVAIFDDDTLPHKDWFKNCLETIENNQFNGILGGSGVIILEKSYLPYEKIGWNGKHLNIPAQVDLVGHAWFFRQEWAKYLWYEKPYTWDNGEDIMFSFLAQKYGNINTFVPPHPENNKDLWSSDFALGYQIGSDENASWRKGNHNELRNKVCRYCIDNGWKTTKNIKK